MQRDVNVVRIPFSCYLQTMLALGRNLDKSGNEQSYGTNSRKVKEMYELKTVNSIKKKS